MTKFYNRYFVRLFSKELILFITMLMIFMTPLISHAEKKEGFSPKSMAEAEKLFKHLFKHATVTHEIIQACKKLGFQLDEVAIGQDSCWRLKPVKLSSTSGYYLIRQNPKLTYMLQAPHSFDDLYTDMIALNTFHEHSLVAVALSTASRSALELTKEPVSYFQAFSQAFIEAYPEGKVIQYHGFTQLKRTSKMAKQSDIIVSSGSESTPAWIKKFHQCLSAKTGLAIHLYPVQVKELGGTLNAQGDLLRQQGSDGFLHIEINYPARQKMKKDAQLRKLLIDCIPGGAH